MKRKIKVGYIPGPDANSQCPRFPTQTPNTVCPYPGLCTEIMSYVAEAAGLEIEPIVLPAVTDEKDNEGLYGYILNNTIDTLCTTERSSTALPSQLTLSRDVYQAKIALVTRILEETMPPDLLSPFASFTYQVWIVCLGAFISFSVILSLMVAWQNNFRLQKIAPEIVWRGILMVLNQASHDHSYSFDTSGNFFVFIFSFFFVTVVMSLYTGNIIIGIMQVRSLMRYKSIEEAACLVESGFLSVLDEHPDRLFSLLGERASFGVGLFRKALDSNPPIIIPNSTEIFNKIETGKNLIVVVEDSNMMMQVRSKCNLFGLDEGLPTVTKHFVFSKDNRQLVEQINAAIGQSSSFIERMVSKYLNPSQLPITQIRSTCQQQAYVPASEIALDFPSTAGIFILVAIGLSCGFLMCLFEMVVKRRNWKRLDAILTTKPQHSFTIEE